jgi:hypothetical protein
VDLISIVDCDLCVTLAPRQKVLDLPLPETWGRLATILGRRGWEEHWSPDPAYYASALDIREIRVCRACGTHYYYRQDHDHHSGEPRPAETDWYLWRITPSEARDCYIDHTGPNGVVEHLDGGWLDRRYQTIIGLLRRDLPRAPDLQTKEYMLTSLYAHYVGNRDWEGLRATLIDYPDPAVGVFAASMIFWATHPDHPIRRLVSIPRSKDDVGALVRAEPARKRLLVAVLAEGLSAQGQMLPVYHGGERGPVGFSGVLRFHYGGEREPVGVSGVAMRTLRTYVPRNSLAPAIRALAAALQQPGSAREWREAARGLLMKYVGAAPRRAREVLKALAGDSDEALAVRTHCQRCLAKPVS